LNQELLERSRKLASEDATENTDRQEETWRRGKPSGAIERESASGDDAMQVGMMLQVLSPGVQDTEQSDIGSQVLRVASDFEQRCGSGVKEQVVKQSLVLQHKSR
jgi:hypothetical protein